MVDLGIGTDIIEINRVKKAIGRPAFLARYYTLAEIELINEKGTAAAAGNFAGKEAVAKAFGTGFRGFSPIDVEILRDGLGKPFVRLHGGAWETGHRLGVQKIEISISHCREYAVAFVVLILADKGGLYEAGNGRRNDDD